MSNADPQAIHKAHKPMVRGLTNCLSQAADLFLTMARVQGTENRVKGL